jgi:hypothetical protein
LELLSAVTRLVGVESLLFVKRLMASERELLARRIGVMIHNLRHIALGVGANEELPLAKRLRLGLFSELTILGVSVCHIQIVAEI